MENTGGGELLGIEFTRAILNATGTMNGGPECNFKSAIDSQNKSTISRPDYCMAMFPGISLLHSTDSLT